jgi:NADPH-dependent glutamate synthase beta subunit-like oxidoreductase
MEDPMMTTETVQGHELITPEATRIGECYECGVCTANCPLAKMIPKDYNPRTTMLMVFLDPHRNYAQIGPWLCMRCRRCSKRCPQKLTPHELFFRIRTHVSEKSQIADLSKRIDEVLKLLEDKLPLPLISGWLCLRPDEVDETSNTMRKPVEEKLREALKRHRESTSQENNHLEKVAVVGSGPAGLAAAHELTKRGYSVTIFEKSSEPGGMLRHGIPDFRLSRDLVDAEIYHLKNLGVVIKTSVCVGKDISVEKLFEDGYKALFIAPGCSMPARLRAQGERLEGVIYAVEFLKELNSGRSIKLGDSVVVIGGGNVGIDAARAAMKLKPQKVQLLCPESREEMPSDLADVARAEKEGLAVHPSCMPKSILGKEGKVTAIECIKTKPGQYDRNGRFLLIPIKGTEFTVEADTVIVAIGQQADLDFLPKEVQVGRGNIIVTDPFTLGTSMSGVFAGGDVVSGPASVFEAIYAGWKAADSIDKHLRTRRPC